MSLGSDEMLQLYLGAMVSTPHLAVELERLGLLPTTRWRRSAGAGL